MSQGNSVTVDVSSESKCHGGRILGGRNVGGQNVGGHNMGGRNMGGRIIKTQG